MKRSDKADELRIYNALVQATIDYYLERLPPIKTSDFDSTEHFKSLKIQAEESFAKGRLTRLKQWFRDLTEMMIESLDFQFNVYLKVKTGYEVDLFQSFHQRINKVIEKGKITTDNQYYDITIMVDQLCQTDPVDDEKVALLNGLMADYEKVSTKRRQ